MAKYSQADKDAYMDYYKRIGKKAQPFGMWMRSKNAGGSLQTRLQRSELSRSDAEEVEKMTTKYKRKKAR